MAGPKEIKHIRMNMWLDKILDNLSRIESNFESMDDYTAIRKELGEQYRLISLLRDTANGKTILKGIAVNHK